MSTQKLKQLKLYKKLQKDLSYRQKLQQKIKLISNPPSSSTQSSKISNKINNNKKYLQQQQINAQIQRQNRILFQKIQSQAIKSQYYNPNNHNNLNNFNNYNQTKSKNKNRSSKTLNAMQQYQNQYYDKNKQSKKYHNLSENKIHYQQLQQTRISLQENQQLIKPKHQKNNRIATELSPQIIELLKSRMIDNQTISHLKQKQKHIQKQTILFQGIAEIDSIRFKVKISIKDKLYLLAGKNKHTQIMLKMDLSQYKKFHKQVLLGNPSAIFQFLVIDKGKIRFRTIQQQQQQTFQLEQQLNMKKQKIYRIDQEDDQDNQDNYKKYKSNKHYHHSNYISPHSNHISPQSNHISPQSNHISPQSMNLKYNNKPEFKFLQQKLDHHIHHSPIQADRKVYIERQIFQPVTIPARHYKNGKSTQKITKKQNIFNNINMDKNKFHQNKQRFNKQDNKDHNKESHDKYKTLQDYISDRQHYKITIKDLRSGQSTQGQIKEMKNRYKLPYL